MLKDTEVLRTGENGGYIRIVLGCIILCMSLFSLLFFGVEPKICGIGFIFGAVLAFIGKYKIQDLYPLRDKENRIFLGCYLLIDIQGIAGLLFGVALLMKLI